MEASLSSIFTIDKKMKRYSLLFGIFMLVASFGAVAQTSGERVFLKPAKVRHYLGGWAYTGYSAMFHNIAETSVCGGFGGGLGIGYQLRTKGFLFNTGLEFEIINSATRVKDLGGDLRVGATNTLRNDGTPIDYVRVKYKYSAYDDYQRVGLVNVPILAGMRFVGAYDYYFLAGIKVGLPVLGYNSTKGRVEVEVLNEINPGNWSLFSRYDDYRTESRGASTFGNVNLMASAEFGVELNRWLDKKEIAKRQQQAKDRKNRTRKGVRRQFERETPRIRAAVFVDYGMTNINRNDNSGSGSPSTPTAFDGHIGHDKPILFDNRNLLTTSAAFDGQGRPRCVTPFMVGVKGSIFWDVTKPKRRYYPPTPILPPPPQLISGKIIDLETKQEIKEAQLVITDTLNNTLFAKNLRGSGRFDTKLRRQGTYRVFVVAPKYQKHKEIVSNVGDTLMVYMQPIKTGTSFVVKNIYFNTNDTSLTAESNKELDKQAKFLKENPNVNITIVGHTDSRGSDEYNLKLSEGRAVSVMRALIDRGIAPERLKAEGRGETQPVASNETEEGRAENRRIEIEVR